MTHAAIFDLDGTLVDTRALYAAAYTAGFTAELATPPTFEQLVARRPSAERHLLLEWYGDEIGDRIHRQVVATYRELAPAHLTGFYEGVEPLLEQLREGGLALGLVTGKSRAAYEITAEHLDFGVFDVVVVEDDVAEPKPDPAGILLALERLGVEPSAALYVGDTPMDLEASWASGVQPALALWGRAPDSRARIRAAALGHGSESVGRMEMVLSASLSSTAHGRRAWALDEPSDLLRELGRG